MDWPFSFQYFGSPMTCQPDDKFSTHCWKHGTSLIANNKKIEENAPCIPKNHGLSQVRTQINAIKSIIKLVFLPLKSQSTYVVYKKL